MGNAIIILSQGSIPWFTLSQSIKFATELGFDGIELVPFKWTTTEIKTYISNKRFGKLKYVKSVHQSWRLDMGRDHEYGISFPQNVLFNTFRLLLFPSPKVSSHNIGLLTNIYKLPVTVHDTTFEWIQCASGQEFPHGIQYEIIGRTKSKEEVKIWLKDSNHSIVVDTRDDQSLSWAKNQGFSDWKEFWKWIGTEKISSVQLTFIGTSTIKKILNNKNSLPEDQLLWLHTHRWKGTVVIEINPLALLWNSGLQFKKGLAVILKFVRSTLIEGRKWSSIRFP